MEQVRHPYGLWPSPLSPASMASALRLGPVAFTSDGRLVWLEGRSGQGVLVCTVGGQAPRDLTTDLSVRARVGYGGGDFTVGAGQVFFVAADGRLYRQPLDAGPAQPITPAFGQCSSPQVSPDGRWVLYIHSDAGVDVVAVVDATGRQWPRQLVRGHDFFMWPRWSPLGDAIAYVCWDHPAMPWESTALHLAPIVGKGALGPEIGPPTVVAGGDNVAIGQPEFAPDGRLLAYVSDASGWNQLTVHDPTTGQHRHLTHAAADHGDAAWSYEQRTYAWSHDNRRFIYRRDEGGFQRLGVVEVATGADRLLPGPLGEYVAIDSLCASPVDGRVAFVGSTTTVAARVVVGEISDGTATVGRRSTAERIPANTVAQPAPLTWGTGDEQAHGLVYPPTSDRAMADGPAPLVVLVHGGPTDHHNAGYSDRVQFLTTRGYGVLALNYRGSTGYGRAYMDALRGQWGVFDVADAVSGARHLIDTGRADSDRVVIMGSSAGGFTVLQALIDHPTFFKAGVCLYGVADHFALAAETHKFEAHYLDGLLGPLPDAAATYRARSPIFHADRIVRPLAVFQGMDDVVVPRAQSDAIVASLARRGVPHEYHLYQGEGHGWRKRETIEAFYTALDAFLRRYVIVA